MRTKEVQIRFTDIDMLGHVNNVVIQQYYDIGKMDYFTEVLGMPYLWQKEAFIIVSLNNSYLSEIKVEEQIAITTRVTKIGSKSISFSQEITDLQTLQVKSRSESVLVAFNLESRKSFEVTPEWRSRIEQHEGGLNTSK